jgi:hypothetical protein
LFSFRFVAIYEQRWVEWPISVDKFLEDMSVFILQTAAKRPPSGYILGLLLYRGVPRLYQ